MSTTNLDELRAAAAKAQEEAERRAAELAAEQEAAERQRRAKIDADTRAWLDQYHESGADEALRADEAKARQAFWDALLADLTWQAWAHYRACRHRLMALANDAENAKARTSDARPVRTVGYRDPRLVEDVLAILDDEARAIALDEQERRWSELGWQ